MRHRKVTIDEFEVIAEELVRKIHQCEEAIADLKVTLAEIAGCDISDWDLETLLKYQELTMKVMEEQMIVMEWGR